MKSIDLKTYSLLRLRDMILYWFLIWNETSLLEVCISEKLKKDGSEPPVLELMENPDILKTLCQAKNRRPGLVVGFAAETEKVIERAVEKRRKKGCDWILANDVSAETGTFGGDSNRIHFVHVDGVEDWPLLTKQEVAACLAERIVVRLGESE